MPSPADFYFADPNDATLATKLVDLNGLAHGDTEGFRVVTASLGGLQTNPTRAEAPPIAGGDQELRWHPTGESELVIDASFNSLANLVAKFTALGNALDDFSVFVYRSDPTAAPLAFDTEPSEVAALFQGQAHGGVSVLQQFSETYTIRFWHHPYPRKAKATLANAVAINNGVGSSAIVVTNPGDVDSEAVVKIEVPDAAAQTIEALIARRDQGNVTTWASSLSAFTLGSPSAPSDYWKKLASKVITPTNAVDLAGTFRVFLAFKPTSADIYHFQLRYGHVNTDPMAYSLDVVDLDLSDVSFFVQTLLPLGIAEFDGRAGKLVLQVWGRAENAASTVDWTDAQLILVPADVQLTRITAPGYRGRHFGLEAHPGDTLVQSPAGLTVNDDDQVILTATNDTVSVRPSGGQTLPAGRHVVEFAGFVQNNDATTAKLGELQVLENTVIIRRATLKGRKGQVWTGWNDDERRRLQFDADPTKTYDIRVRYTEAAVAGRKIFVGAIRMWFIPLVANSYRFVLDGFTESAHIADASGVMLWRAHSQAFLRLGPGAQAVDVLLLDAPAQNYDDVDYRGPLPKFVPTRSANLTIDVYPRVKLPVA